MIFFFYFLILFIPPYIKLINGNFNYYDAGFYLESIYKFSNFEFSINTNFSVILLPFSLFLKYLNLINLETLFFFQSMFLCLPLFFSIINRNKYLLFTYLIFPSHYYWSYLNIHIDAFAYPFLFIVNSLYFDKYNKKYFLLVFIILISIKFYYLLLLIGYLIYDKKYEKKINLNWITILIYFSLFLLAILIFYNEAFEQNIYYSIIESINLYNYKTKALFIIILIFYLNIYFLIFNKIKYLLIILPIFLFFTISPSINILKFYNHYILILIPLCFHIYFKTVNNKLIFNDYTFYKLLGLQLILHIIISCSVISLPTYFKINQNVNLDSYYQKPIDENTKKFINNYIIENNIKNITFPNNLIIKELINKTNIYIYPEYKKSELIILRKKMPYFEYDKLICQFNKECLSQKKQINFFLESNNFFKLYEDKLIHIFKTKIN